MGFGRCRCERHGLQPVVDVCTHVNAALREGRLIPCEECIDRYSCEPCIEEFGLRRFRSSLLEMVGPEWDDLEEAMEEASKAVSSNAWCERCYEELIARIKSG